MRSHKLYRFIFCEVFILLTSLNCFAKDTTCFSREELTQKNDGIQVPYRGKDGKVEYAVTYLSSGNGYEKLGAKQAYGFWMKLHGSCYEHEGTVSRVDELV